MHIKSQLCYIFIFICISSCTKEDFASSPKNLAEWINSNTHLIQDEVIACAASAPNNNATSFVFYYPIPTATNIRYFETENTAVDPNDFSLYKPVTLPKEPVFGGYLERFVRPSTKEVWCMVTYTSKGRFHRSNPIRLKQQSKPTEWTSQLTINTQTSLQPKFIWKDGHIKENTIYFQVIADQQQQLLSGTYTYEKCFQYNNFANVVLHINRMTPPSLISNSDYNFTLMGVSTDNWVNLVVQKSFTAN